VTRAGQARAGGIRVPARTAGTGGAEPKRRWRRAGKRWTDGGLPAPPLSGLPWAPPLRRTLRGLSSPGGSERWGGWRSLPPESGGQSWKWDVRATPHSLWGGGAKTVLTRGVPSGISTRLWSGQR
jgi:hypothetical protein